MTDALRPLGHPRLYEQVVERLRQHVDAAGLKSGDRLPAERELAERLGVSRASIKQAMVVLEVQGLVAVRQGGGVYLRADRLSVEPVSVLVERRHRLPDVLDARAALETKFAELAAQRSDAGDLEAIEGALAEMRRAVAGGEHGEDGDRRFHAAVAAAAHSPLLSQFYAEIAAPIGESRAESLRQPGRPSRSLVQHEQIARAIEERQPAKAAAAMRRHIDSVRRVRLLSWDPTADDDPGCLNGAAPE